MKIYLHRDINIIYVSGLHDDELTTETDSLIISHITWVCSFISCTVRLRKYHTPVEFVKQLYTGVVIACFIKSIYCMITPISFVNKGMYYYWYFSSIVEELKTPPSLCA